MEMINKIQHWIFPKSKPIPAGMYHYQSPPENIPQYRLHLRVEPDGCGLLILNASTVLHLNQTAVEYAYHLVKGTVEDDILDQVTSRYHVARQDALKDYQEFIEKIQNLIDLPDVDPVHYLGVDRTEPYSGSITAPYRLDCALTYDLPPGIPPDAAPRKRVTRELSTVEWKTILDKAWGAGIPQITFTGGEPTLRADLPELVAHAEELGQVTGILTLGTRLDDSDYLNNLLNAGLDHILISLQPGQEGMMASLSGLTYWSTLVPADLHIGVHWTITEENQERGEEIIQQLAKIGSHGLSLSANNADLSGRLHEIREAAANHGIALIWDLPVPYSQINPVRLELAEGSQAVPENARAWLYVEPDGDVLPRQGVNKVLGNMLTDKWEDIWHHPDL